MQWNSVPNEEPSIIFPIGAIIEDQKGKYEILEFLKQQNAHKYKVKILEQKMPIPDHMKQYVDLENHWILVLPQNLGSIKRIQ